MAAESVRPVVGAEAEERDSEPACDECVLRRNGPYVLAAGAALGTLRRGLRTLRLRPRTADGVWGVGAEDEPMYDEPYRDEKALRFPAGLSPAAHLLLKDSGVAVRIVGSPKRLREPSVVRGHDHADGPFLEFVSRRDRGLVRVGPSVRPARLVEQVALAWPELRVAAVVDDRAAVRCVYGELRRILPDVSEHTGRPAPADAAGRVVVCTFMGLADADPHILDVILVLDAVQAAPWLRRRWLSHTGRARLFGLLSPDARPSPYEQDGVRAVFGFDEEVVPRHGMVERPAQVVWHRIDGLPVTASASDGLAALKNEGLWSHPIRNRRIRRMAARLGGGDRSVLRDAFPCGGGKLAVLVLVESAKHQNNLLRRPPARPPVVWAGRPDDASAGGGGGEAGVPYRVETFNALTAEDVAGADVLIRADGGVGLPPLPDGALLSPADAPPRRLVLVDFDDCCHGELRRRSRQRRAAYGRRGWHLPGTDATVERVRHFLDGRPNGGEM